MHLAKAHSQKSTNGRIDQFIPRDEFVAHTETASAA